MSAVRRQVAGTPPPHIRTRNFAPETNGVVKCWNRSVEYEDIFQREIDDAATLAKKVEAFLAPFNEVRPHESHCER